MKCQQFAIENGPFIVDLPILKVVIFHSYVSLLEGVSHNNIQYIYMMMIVHIDGIYRMADNYPLPYIKYRLYT